MSPSERLKVKFLGGNPGGLSGFVTTFREDGSGIGFSTYPGGSGGDSPWALAVDQRGDLWAAGDTDSPDFPVVNGIQPQNAGGRDLFLSKFSGSDLTYSTYFGGSGNDGSRVALALGPGDELYVGTRTESIDLNLVSPLQAVFGWGI